MNQDDLNEVKKLIPNKDISTLKFATSELAQKLETLWKRVFGKTQGTSVGDTQNSSSDIQRYGARYALSAGAEPNVDGTGSFLSDMAILFGTREVQLGTSNAGTGKFGADINGNVFAGSDISAAATTAWNVFAVDQTYNSESLGAGDMMLGDNSANKANILWDASAGQLKFRSGTTTYAYIDTDGTLVTQLASIGGWDITSILIQKLVANVGIILDSSDQIVKVGDTSGVHIQIDGKNKRIRSSNFVTGSKGFNIDGATGDAEFNNIKARGSIKTVVFEKDTISTIGGTVLVLPGDALASDMTALDSSTLTILGEETFAVGDILRMKDGTDDEWLEVTSIASAPTYSVTRDKAAAYAANSNPAWKAGQAVANYMKSGDGGVAITSGATPKISVFTHAGSPWTTITEQAYMSEVGVKAGAGAVTLDALGIRILKGTGSTNFLGWVDSSGNLEGYINTDSGAGGSTLAMIALKSGQLNEVVINGYGDQAAGNENSLIHVTGGNSSSTRGFGYTRIGTVDYLYWSPAGIYLNYDGADVDTIIKGDTTNVLTVDAGLEAVGIGGAAESGKALKVTGIIKATSDVEASGGVNVGTSTGAGNGDVKGSGELIMEGTGASSVGGSFAPAAFLGFGQATTLTIASGAVTATKSYHVLATEGAAATDDLDTINGGAVGDILILRSANSAQDPTAKDGTGNMQLAGDFIFTHINDTLMLIKIAANLWVELSRSDNS